MAQQQSEIISLSLILPCAIAAHKTGIANLIWSYLGKGLPLHRFDRAQQQCFINV